MNGGPFTRIIFRNRQIRDFLRMGNLQGGHVGLETLRHPIGQHPAETMGVERRRTNGKAAGKVNVRNTIRF